jgi:hypothetical protein
VHKTILSHCEYASITHSVHRSVRRLDRRSDRRSVRRLDRRSDRRSVRRLDRRSDYRTIGPSVCPHDAVPTIKFCKSAHIENWLRQNYFAPGFWYQPCLLLSLFGVPRDIQVTPNKTTGSQFLGACKRLYKILCWLVCPLVGWLVGWLVCPSIHVHLILI